MIDPEYIEIIKKWVKILKLEDWVINIVQITPTATCQIKNGVTNYFLHNNVYAITYVLPTSKVAEIYIYPNDEDKNTLILHELLHIETSKWILQQMYYIENIEAKNTKDARQLQHMLREEEHRYIKNRMEQLLGKDTE